MATAKNVKTQTQHPTATTTVEPVMLPVTTETTVTLADLQAQRRLLDDQIKSLRTGQKTDRLAELDRRQRENPNKSLPWLLWSMAQRRVDLGQPEEEAKAAVIQICKLWMEKELVRVAFARLLKANGHAVDEPDADADTGK